MSWENFCDSAAEEDGQVVITDATGRVFYGKSRNATISFEDVAALAGELSAPTFPFRFRGEEMMSRERRHNLFVATKPYTMFVVVVKTNSLLIVGTGPDRRISQSVINLAQQMQDGGY
eukprot:TRINITY_DN2640_c0_g1_i10.p1 TRINITY_DN2640_c0_g1~~TRINITY_DN2640_c0_g1_i10.p1  ORF type:complete len:118 (-),score=14.94 TRINITY_DN2640_c0_g1_i10:42-395(-)